MCVSLSHTQSVHFGFFWGGNLDIDSGHRRIKGDEDAKFGVPLRHDGTDGVKEVTVVTDGAGPAVARGQAGEVLGTVPGGAEVETAVHGVGRVVVVEVVQGGDEAVAGFQEDLGVVVLIGRVCGPVCGRAFSGADG